MELLIAQIGRLYIDSIAGVGTSVVIPGLDLSIDLGFLTKPSLRTSVIALTHLHPDHVAGIHGYLGIRSLYGKGPARFLLPYEAEDVFKRFLMSLDRMQSRPFEWYVTGVGEGDSLQLKGDFVLKVFPTTHSVPSVGYAIIQKKLKLKPQYTHLSGPEIAARRAQGDTQMFVWKEDPILVVTGDTTLQGIIDNPLLQEARHLIVETTFLDHKKEIPAAHLGNHIHLEELIPLLQLWKSHGKLPSRIVLYHISQLYKPEEAIRIVKESLPPELKDQVIVVPPRWPG